MSKKSVNDGPRFVGLLECPLRKGYIEFEYTSGVTTAELKVRVLENWGHPFKGQERKLFGGFYPHFQAKKAWSILVEDTEGAYLPLEDDDKIPLTPPSGASVKVMDVIQEHLQTEVARWHRPDWEPIPAGVIYDPDHRLRGAQLDALSAGDIKTLYKAREEGRKAQLLEKSLPRKNFRLLLRIERNDYEVPQRKYSIRLVALATLTGG